MKVLVVTYYWPPSGGSGVQRWLKFVKYLAALGVEVHVYTPESPDFDVKDESLLSDIPQSVRIVKQPIKEPYVYYRALLGKKNTKGSNFGFTQNNKSNYLQKIAIWIRSNLFIPDARVWWVKPSVSFLKEYITEHQIENVITTGPPHSMHLIGLGLKKYFKTNIQWLTDFRDPWTRIYTNEELSLSRYSKNRLAKLEKEVIENCDKLVTVSDFLKQEFELLGAKGKAYTIYNGFDTTDYLKSREKQDEIDNDSKFVISYIGLFPGLSNPSHLWKKLAELVETNQDFKNDLKIVLVGNIDSIILNDIDENGLLPFVELTGIVPHDIAVEYQKKSDLLLLCIPNVLNSKGILTGKLFEYLASKKPILAFGDVAGDVAKILKETNGGELFSYDENEGIRAYILKQYELYSSGFFCESTINYLQFSRVELTNELVRIIEN